jgi:hypothetical protein
LSAIGRTALRVADADSVPRAGRNARLAFSADCAHDECFPSRFTGVVPMVLCPIALAVTCRKCPIFSVCPVKSVIGDYKPDVKDSKSAAGPKKAAKKK